jgi:hypothetical protein
MFTKKNKKIINILLSLCALLDETNSPVNKFSRRELENSI